LKEKVFTIVSDKDIKKANKFNYNFIADFTKSKRTAILPNEFEGSKVHIFLCRPTVNTIGEKAFSSCTSLTNFGGLPQIIGDKAFYFCSSLETFEFENVRSIGSSAFEFTNLKEFNAGKDLKLLKDNTFNGCFHLTNVNLGNIEGIGHHCFASTGITSITLNKELRKIGNQAFEACIYLKNIICLCHEPPRLCESSLIGTNVEKIWIPNKESLEKYKAAKYWSEYADIMQLIDWNAIKAYLDHLKKNIIKTNY
jgi:hypothetical protein